MTILTLKSQNIVLHLIPTSTAIKSWMALSGVKIHDTVVAIYVFTAPGTVIKDEDSSPEAQGKKIIT